MKRITTAIVLLLLLSACGGSNTNKSSQDQLSRKEDALLLENLTDQTTTDTAARAVISDDQKKQQPKPGPQEKPDWDKKIIKDANLDLEVKDYNNYYKSLRDKVRSVGGYIAREEQTESEYKLQNSLSIKVPVDQFDDAVSLLTQDAEKINTKSVSSQDVTTEYVDTRSRLESKKQVRLKYLELLKQARNMEEILNVQSEINQIQEEIESATGRIEYLSHSASFSTINLTYYQVLNASAKNIDNPGFGTQLGKAFRDGADWILDLVIGLVSIWPLFLAIFASIMIYRQWKRHQPAQPLKP